MPKGTCFILSRGSPGRSPRKPFIGRLFTLVLWSRRALPPDYSFCMLCYNDASNVEAAVGSLLDLRDSIDMEIVAVDNRSKDGSWEKLLGFAREGVKYVSK